MPSITYTSQIDARTTNTNGPALSGEAFGTGIARAVQGLGQDTMQAGQNLAAIEEQKRKEKLAAGLAKADYTDRELNIRNEVDANGDEYQQRISTDYDEWTEEQVSEIQDDKLRNEMRLSLQKDKQQLMARSAQYQHSVAAESSVMEANDGLNLIQNRIAQQPDQYDSLTEKGELVILSRPDVPAVKKQAMVQQFRYDAAQRRFDGMMSNAKTAQDLDGIAAELANVDGKGRDWQAEMLPTDYKTLLDQIGSNKRAFQAQAKTVATASVGTLEDRNKNTVTLIPDDQLQEAQAQVMLSGDGQLVQRISRVTRNQAILKESMRLPPAEIRSQINAVNGNPGLAYPGLPPELSGAINRAQEKFGVNVGYLGGSITREYGSKLKRKSVKLDEQFKPMAISEGVDLRNMRSDVMEAVTVAGQALGRPLEVTKGTGSAGLAGVDISTVGMSPQDKAKLAASLVDAGFTGVEEQKNYMRFDMRSAVPQSFGKGKDGQFWGGASALSPEVVKTLEAKGYAAGAAADTIKRNGPKKEGIDYGAPTDILNENGERSSSAVGVLQFVEGTWLQYIDRADVAEAAGIDTSKMTEQQKLDLRKDPNVSIMVGAAYAADNKKVLEGALGRDVSTAEIHMAHFMGAGGAATFLGAYKNKPNVYAADIMPVAAAANAPVFYRNPKGDRKSDANKKTVSEIYNDIADDFTVSPSQVAFDDNEMRKNILKNTENALSVDPMAHASQVGSHVVTPLFEGDDDSGFAARGNTTKSVADYYGIPMSDMKPFTQDEATYIKTQLDEGNAQRQMEIMGSIQSMGSIEASRAALKQIGQKDPVFQHAGDLYLNGNSGVASEILKGRKMLTENPALKDQMGASDAERNSWFVEGTGGALFGLPPQQRQATQDSAMAYWAAHYAASGQPMDENQFLASVQAVTGGSEDAPAIDDVNGQLALLPPGISGEDMESAFSRMSIGDFMKFSADGQPPRYSDGTVINPADVEGELMMRAVGGGKYQLILDDGSVLTTGATDGTNAKYYLFQPDAKELKRIANRPTTVAELTPQPTPTPEPAKPKEDVMPPQPVPAKAENIPPQPEPAKAENIPPQPVPAKAENIPPQPKPAEPEAEQGLSEDEMNAEPVPVKEVQKVIKDSVPDAVPASKRKGVVEELQPTIKALLDGGVKVSAVKQTIKEYYDQFLDDEENGGKDAKKGVRNAVKTGTAKNKGDPSTTALKKLLMDLSPKVARK